MPQFCSSCDAVLPKDVQNHCPECGHEVDAPEADLDRETDVEPSPARRSRASRREVEAPADAVMGLPLIAAVGVAILGAVAWAFIAYKFSYEIGWLAWGIGAGIGGVAVATGGRGITLAIICGALALVSLFAGKWLGASMSIGSGADTYLATLTDADYAEMKADAAGWAALDGDRSSATVRAYMDDYGYGQEPSATEAEAAMFLEENAASLERFQRDQPDFDGWKANLKEEIVASIDTIEVVKEDLGAMDLLFIALGVGTAFMLVYKATEEANVQTKMAARQAARRE